MQAGEQHVRVNQDTRLNFRVLDLRTSHSITSWKCKAFHLNFILKSLTYSCFVEIHTPKLIAGSSEGGAAVFRLGYKGHPACLIQSPHLHRQMAICADFGRDFEISPAFSAEDSFTHRHLCEFPGLDVEMEIKKHYYEIMDKVDRLFVSIFDSLNQNCKKALEAVHIFVRLCSLHMKKGFRCSRYGTEFYILYWYPLAVRPFYTRSCYDEEIISGAQCVHNAEMLKNRLSLAALMSRRYLHTFIISGILHGPLLGSSCHIHCFFVYGAPTHRGFGVGLELVVMLFYSLNNIRKTSFYLGNPLRIAP
ncbi:hypothetical protein Ahy_B03g064241 [Arachis hypogaea]|uniref:aspartate--tRNA ligase n=1 Tax=Arachis hypogaea TaxID=3818 RepID=A0A444ZZ53_ARAHY|nr:hypothetical protein Ahy_B03g064241 [Arachis hypogaea]